jgi:ATP-dependent exoDNAse (exonuclease V) alpha subunit
MIQHCVMLVRNLVYTGVSGGKTESLCHLPEEGDGDCRPY